MTSLVLSYMVAKDSYGFAITQAIRGAYVKLAMKLVERDTAKTGGLQKLECWLKQIKRLQQV